MCGIAGAFSLNTKDLGPRVRKAMDVIRHRGPDDDGLFEDKLNNGSIALGHVRLAIIDPEFAKQPVFNEDESVVCVFNGCIYNYLELRRDLLQDGHKFKTHSDTEVIVHAYEKWGEECLQYFNGAFAIVIWDRKKQQLFVARDRMGIKPFYYYYDGKSLVFGSEIKAILATDLVKAEVNNAGLEDYLTFQLCLGEKTLFKNIKKIMPGHYFTFKPGGDVNLVQFWDIHFNLDNDHTEDYFINRIQFLLEDAVGLRLRSDVPIGAYLSGGLDSSAIVSTACNLLSGSTMKTFTGAFKESKDFDETEYAKEVARVSGAEYMEIFMTPDKFPETMDKLIWHMDEPAAGPGGFPQFLVSQLATKHVKVVLSGEGGDEMFVGYARYLVAYLEECLKGAIFETADRGHYVATLGTIVPNLSLLQKYVPMLDSFWKEGLFGDFAHRYFHLMDRSGSMSSLFNPQFFGSRERIFSDFEKIFNNREAASFVNKILYFDIKTHLQALLHLDDRVNAAWSLESRAPLLDHRLVELVGSISPVIKFKNGETKYMFKKAIKQILPEKVFNRKDKMGFPVPLSQWYQNELKDYLHDTLLSEKARQRGIFDVDAMERMITKESKYGRAVWGALCLELWFRHYIDN